MKIKISPEYAFFELEKLCSQNLTIGKKKPEKAIWRNFKTKLSALVK